MKDSYLTIFCHIIDQLLKVINQLFKTFLKKCQTIDDTPSSTREFAIYLNLISLYIEYFWEKGLLNK